MDSATAKAKLISLYPAFESMPEAALNELLDQAIVKTVPKGTVMFDEMSPCGSFPMVLEGSVKVVKTAPNGRELQLYRVLPGESCILSTGCSVSMRPSATMSLGCSPNGSPS